MPTYEYHCEGCGHRFDEFQSFKDDVLTVCPTCKEAKLRRLFGTGAAILFKGSGFYETDYRSENYKQAAKAESDATGKSNGTASSDSAGAKPAETPKPDTKSSSSPT